MVPRKPGEVVAVVEVAAVAVAVVVVVVGRLRTPQAKWW